MHANADSMLDAIADIALQIARTCPDCADAATRITKLVSEVRGAALDRGAIRDAVETGTADSDLSDARLDATVEAVVKMSRSPD